MAFYYDQPSRTFSEYLLVPGYSSAECVPANVSLTTPLVKFKKGEAPALSLNVPLVSAIMQSVSNDTMAIALAREGGVSFIYCSQSIEKQVEMVRRVKSYKAGFVTTDSAVHADNTLADILRLKEKTGHSTVAVTEDGTSTGKLIGIITSRDYRVSRMDHDTKVSSFMTPLEKIIYAKDGISLREANDIIWEHKINALPIIDDNQRLVSFVFRKDYDTHKENLNELLDDSKRYIVGAGVNTRDYEQRIPALVEAGVDVLCIDSSEGFSEWQQRTLAFVREKYGDNVKIGAGNIVDREVSASWPTPVRISSRSALAAARSVSRAKRRALAAVRRPPSSKSLKRAMNTSRKRVFTSRSAPMAASSTIITSRWRWRWAVTSACWGAILPALMKVPRTRSSSTATI